MLRIADIQRRSRIIGKIRMGETVSTQNGKTRPTALDEWRFTSSDKALLELVATMYGGEVTEWEGHPGQFELYGKSSEIIIVARPLSADVKQDYQYHTAAGRLRTCDGETCEKVDAKTGERTIVPCMCDSIPDKRDRCTLNSRVNVELAGVPALGVWSFTTHGGNAAAELPSDMEKLNYEFPEGYMAVLGIESRESKVIGEGTRHYKVPVLRFRPGLFQETMQRGGLVRRNEIKALSVDDTPALELRPELPAPTTDLNTEIAMTPEQKESARKIAEIKEATEALGVTKESIKELKELYAKTKVSAGFNEFMVVCHRSGDKNIEEVKTRIAQLMPPATVPPSEPIEGEVIAEDPFKPKQEQSEQGGLM